jgi:hypothetical protein
MLVEIQWYDKTHQTVLCQIGGEWSYSGYNHAYMQLISYARQVSGKINLICDMTHAESLLEDAALLRVSPFIHQAVIVTSDINHPAVKQMEHILLAQSPTVALSHTSDIAHAMIKIRRGVTVGT